MVKIFDTHGYNAGGEKHVAKPKTALKREGRSARPWRRIRDRVLLRDGYACVKCGRIGCKLEVDHIKQKSEGGTDEESNLQTLCELCHKIKSANENGNIRSSMLPQWLPVSQKPIILVCGRPASGKTTYAKANAAPNDLIVDIDSIAAEMRRDPWNLNSAERNVLVRIRNDRLAAFMRGETRHERCWVVTVAGKDYHREFWKERGAEIIEMPTAVDICQRRINARDIPTKKKIALMEIAQSWS